MLRPDVMATMARFASRPSKTKTISSMATKSRLLHRSALSSTSVFVTGQGWTGALGLGQEAMTDGEISDGSLISGGEGAEELVELPPTALSPPSCVAAAAGWGHSAFLAHDAETNETSLSVAGRPQDFQTLLRLKRLPAFMRRYVVRNSLKYDDGTVRPDREAVRTARSAVTKLIDGFLTSGTEEREEMLQRGEEDIEIRYGLYPTPTAVTFPNGDEPALPGIGDDDGIPTRGNVLAASAGLTAVIGKSGTLYTFGLNHRGQCGVGEQDMFNVWDPTPVAGLSLRQLSEDNVDVIDYGDQENNTDNKSTSNSGQLEMETVKDQTNLRKRKKRKGRAALTQDHRICSVALGLQHGLALDETGQLYSWGKGERGQLGIPEPGERSTKVIPETEYSAVPVVDFCPEYTFETQLLSIVDSSSDALRPRRDKRLSGDDARVTRISAGLNHSAAITASNQAWVWGKNVLPYDSDSGDDDASGGIKSPKPGKHAEDAMIPALVPGLPPDLAILDVSCGSHHTAFLLEDGSVYAIGVATDNVRPIYGGAVEMVPPDIIDMPPRQFKSHFDRTTIVGNHGDQILEVQLWSHEELRDGAEFEPGWVDALLTHIDNGKEEERGVRQVQKGWMHSVVITD